MSAIPRFPRFVNVDLGLKPEVQAFTRQHAGYSDFNFTNLHSWNNDDGIAVSWLFDNLVVRFRDYVTNETFYTFLGNKHPVYTAQTLLGQAKHSGFLPNLKLIPEEIALKLQEADQFIITEDQDNNDYILSLQKLAQLVGRPQAHTRELVNRFKRELGPASSFIELDLNNEQTKVEILHIFHDREDLKITNDEVNEKDAITRLLNNFESYDLVAYGIRVDKKLRAFIICELQDAHPVLAHFWKADTRLRGIYHYLLNCVARELQQLGHELLNFEQDLGIPGLRAAKQFLRPEKFLRKYTVTLPVSRTLFKTEPSDDVQGIGMTKISHKYAGAIDGVLG